LHKDASCSVQFKCLNGDCDEVEPDTKMQTKSPAVARESRRPKPSV